MLGISTDTISTYQSLLADKGYTDFKTISNHPNHPNQATGATLKATKVVANNNYVEAFFHLNQLGKVESMQYILGVSEKVVLH